MKFFLQSPCSLLSNFRKAYHNFDISKCAKLTEKDVQTLLNDAGIIRNRLKIEAAIENAKCCVRIQKQYGSVAKYLWSFVADKPVQNKFAKMADLPDRTEKSDEMAATLKKEGFKFLGSRVIYAFLQSCGFVNDHLLTCECRAVCGKLGQGIKAKLEAGDKKGGLAPKTGGTAGGFSAKGGGASGAKSSSAGGSGSKKKNAQNKDGAGSSGTGKDTSAVADKVGGKVKSGGSVVSKTNGGGKKLVKKAQMKKK